MQVKDALLLYSEWLDADQGIMMSRTDDERTHEDLVRDFLQSELPEFLDNGEEIDITKAIESMIQLAQHANDERVRVAAAEALIKWVQIP